MSAAPRSPRRVTVTLSREAAEALRDIALDMGEVQSYGHFPGGDPRSFSPDEECSTPEERAAHKAACEAWAQGDETRVRARGFGLGVWVHLEPRLQAAASALDAALARGEL